MTHCKLSRRLVPAATAAVLAAFLVLPATLRAESVILYGRESCSRCVHLQNWLIEKKIPFQYHDVDSSAEKRREMWSRVKKKSKFRKSINLPVVYVKGSVIISASPEKVQRALARNVTK